MSDPTIAPTRMMLAEIALAVAAYQAQVRLGDEAAQDALARRIARLLVIDHGRTLAAAEATLKRVEEAERQAARCTEGGNVVSFKAGRRR